MSIRLSEPMYVIQANKKHDLYLGFTHTSNSYEDKILQPAQNVIEFAFFFKTKEHAESFLKEYFNNTEVKEENKRFYSVKLTFTAETEVNHNVFMYNVPCYFSLSSYKKWRLNPDSYKVRFN